MLVHVLRLAHMARALQPRRGRYAIQHASAQHGVHPPPVACRYAIQGFDAFLGNGGGTYMSPRFLARGLGFAGIPDGWLHSDRWLAARAAATAAAPAPDASVTVEASTASTVLGTVPYSTSIIGNASVAWIRHVTGPSAPSQPFFAFIAPKAAHEPFTPAPWHLDAWDASWPATEPRPAGVWNATFAGRADHPGVIATNPMMSAPAAAVVTGVFKNRWRTLLAVDDVVEAVVQACEAAGALEATFFVYTSDHGFTLGEMNMLMDKRHAYAACRGARSLARAPSRGSASSGHLLALSDDGLCL